MSKIKIKQIHSDGQPAGAVLTTDGNGNNQWVVAEAASGSNVLLGPAEDGSYTDSRYTGGKAPAAPLQPTTKVSSAIDSINEILGLLLPTAPAPLSTGVLSLQTTNTSAKATQGYSANSLANAPAPGATVSRTTAATTSTNVLQDLGDGTTGVISLFVQDAAVSGETLAFTENPTDAKATGVLRITDNRWNGTAVGGGQAPDGFFQSFDSQVVGATSPVGLNHIQLQHSYSGNTNVLAFVRDDLTANPVVSGVTVTEGTTPTTANFSGVPHYVSGATLNVAGSATNLAGQTYVAGTILALSGAAGPTVNFTAGQAGLPAILNVNTLNYAMPAQTFTVGGNFQARGTQLTLTATNPNGSGNASGGNLNVWSGTGGVSDTAMPAKAGTATRVVLGTNNVDTPSSLTNTAWSANASLAGATNYEAATVGGVARSDQTNYSTGYLPVGPDYSAKPTTQYVTYRFAQAALSSITVNITGSYAGMWVALPGVSDSNAISPNAKGGVWWDAKALYSGSGVPGKTNDTAAGCANGTAATGTTGATVITFGSQSSSNSTSNYVYVRVKLTAGQSISAISIS